MDAHREEALVLDFQYRVASCPYYLEGDMGWREDGMVYGTLEAAVTRGNPSDENSHRLTNLEVDLGCRGRGKFGSNKDTRRATSGAHFVGLKSMGTRTIGNH